jgi:protein-S-isoprenylcysteine O-methyltransferase Ste14
VYESSHHSLFTFGSAQNSVGRFASKVKPEQVLRLQGEIKMSTINRAIPRYFLQIGIFVSFFAASLFLSAGRIDWVMGWVFIAIVAASQISIALILMVRNPELMGERDIRKGKGKRDLDRILSGVMTLFGPLSMCIVAGLNIRFGWSPQIPFALQIAGIVLAILGSILPPWAMVSNKFFYGVLRIAQEKGHTVCTSGPYQYVRHPGYLGAILFDLAIPLILNSVWALIPAVLTVYAIFARTALEDKSLQNGLDGYKDYTRQVRYRLLPAVW